jgi:hypothetical protein
MTLVEPGQGEDTNDVSASVDVTRALRRLATEAALSTKETILATEATQGAAEAPEETTAVAATDEVIPAEPSQKSLQSTATLDWVVVDLSEKPAGLEWKVTDPDPTSMHPLRLERIAAKAGNDSDWLNNKTFWKTFCKVLADSGQSVEETSADSIFDFAQNRDYREYKGKKEGFIRGGVEYTLPVGFMRFAVRVAGCYDNGNNAWMRLNGSAGEWAVVYHGTAGTALASILFDGLRAGQAQVYKKEVGEGIYVTPCITTAWAYARRTSLDVCGRKAIFVLQCRCRPDAIRKTSQDRYWVVNNPVDLRPYAVLVQEYK